MKLKKAHKEMAIELGTKRRYSMCWKKKKLNEVEAEHFSKKYKQRFYECPICSKFHLTSNI